MVTVMVILSLLTSTHSYGPRDAELKLLATERLLIEKYVHHAKGKKKVRSGIVIN
jgi:hypothetical protein